MVNTGSSTAVREVSAGKLLNERRMSAVAAETKKRLAAVRDGTSRPLAEKLADLDAQAHSRGASTERTGVKMLDKLESNHNGLTARYGAHSERCRAGVVHRSAAGYRTIPSQQLSTHSAQQRRIELEEQHRQHMIETGGA